PPLAALAVQDPQWRVTPPDGAWTEYVSEGMTSS
ncbi:hypothetical protein Tco_0667556, partial [Tanacetum coccineum]